MTKAEKFKKILNMVRHHGEVIVYFRDKYDLQRRRKIRINGDCFVSYLALGSGDWTNFAMSCFLMESDKRKSLTNTINLLKRHDGSYLAPWAIEVDKRKVEL